MLSKRTEKIILALLLLFAAALRIYRFNEIPFTYDEFSALFRTNVTGFFDLIERGVKTDNHPALVQVFLFYWIKLFGNSTVAVKLPFAILGLFSVYLTYTVGKQLFTAQTGLLAATVMAFSQGSLLYSQVARPYATGVVFMLSMALYWHKMVSNGFTKNKYIALFVLFAGLCCYNHHFSLLACFFFYGVGALFIPRNFLIKYLAAGVCIGVLYVPHIAIFLEQLSHGGNGEWLPKPGPGYLLNYTSYLLHFSWFVIGVVLLMPLIFGVNWQAVKNKYFLISFFTFLLTFAVGYAYSVLRNPVLQYAMLYFTVPFLCFSFFSILKIKQKNYTLVASITALSLVLIVSLFIERKHYYVLINCSSNTILSNAANESKLKEDSRPTLFISAVEPIVDFYRAKNDYGNLSVIQIRNLPPYKLRAYLDTLPNKYMAYGFSSDAAVENLPVILQYFPQVVKHLQYYGQDYYLLSKEKTAFPYYDKLYWADSIGNYSVHEKSYIFEDDFVSNDRIHYNINSNIEYVLTFSESLKNTVYNPYNLIDYSVSFSNYDTATNAKLVSVLECDGQVVDWRTADFNNYYNAKKIVSTAFLSLKLSDVRLKNYNSIMLKMYVWNPNNGSFTINKSNVNVRDGNPLIYSLYYKIP